MKNTYVLMTGNTTPLSEKEMREIEGGKYFTFNIGSYISKLFLKLTSKKKKKK